MGLLLKLGELAKKRDGLARTERRSNACQAGMGSFGVQRAILVLFWHVRKRLIERSIDIGGSKRPLDWRIGRLEEDIGRAYSRQALGVYWNETLGVESEVLGTRRVVAGAWSVHSGSRYGK